MHFSVVGNIVKDIELKTSKKGFNYAKITVAENNYKGDATYTNYFEIWVHNTTAVFLANNAIKGVTVFIEGKIDDNNYEREDGTKAYGKSFNAIECKIVGFPKNYEKPSVQHEYKRGKNTSTNNGQQIPAFEMLPEDDVPF